MKILFRNILPGDETEIEIARGHFDVIESRTQVQKGDIVIGRYSVLPFYKELEHDLKLQDVKLINEHWQHQFMADLENWYSTLEQYTPKTWFSLREAMQDEYDGEYVLKGRTNSRKHQWKTHMYAENKHEMRQVYFRLQDDGLIGSQGIVIRKYEPLRNFGYDLAGMPITNEHRYFVLGGELVASGFYWSTHPEIEQQATPPDDTLPKKIIEACKGHANFYSFDLAQKENGEWTLIELNDGQMAGLSCIDPETFYKNLARIARKI